jgi:hypothetical protein
MTRSAIALPKNTTAKCVPNSSPIRPLRLVSCAAWAPRRRADPERQGRDHQPAQEQRHSDVVAHRPLATPDVHHYAAGPGHQRRAAEQCDQIAGPAPRRTAENPGLSEAEHAGGEGEKERDAER